MPAAEAELRYVVETEIRLGQAVWVTPRSR